MKNSILFRLFLGAVFLVVSFANPENWDWLIGTAEGVILAITPIPGGTISEQDYVENADELFERDVDDLITIIKPDRYPLTTMLHHAKSAKKASARKVEWVEVGYHARLDTVSSTYAGGDTTANIAVTTIDQWKISDKVYIPSIMDGSGPDASYLHLYVYDKTETQIVVRKLGAGNIPAIPEGTEIYRLNQAASARQASAEPRGSRAVMPWNYVEGFIGQFETEKILRYISTYSDDFRINEELAIYEFKNSRENARKFGKASKVKNKKDEDVYTMNGVEKYLGKTLTYSSADELDSFKFIDWCKDVFSDTAGSDERVMLGGSELMAKISKVKEVEKQIEARKTEVVLGIQVKRVETLFGNLFIKFDKGFDEVGRSNDGMILDMQYINDRILEPMHTTELELDKTGQARVEADRIIEHATVQVRYPGCHANVLFVNESSSS